MGTNLRYLLLFALLTFGCSAGKAGAEDVSSVGDATTPGAEVRQLTVGSQTWMAENLRVVTPNSKCYDDDPQNCALYGRLYDFIEAQTACPAGWRLPSDDDWKLLEKQLGMSDADLDILDFSQTRGSDEGAQLRIGGSSGFGLPMAGYATSQGYLSLGDKTYLWSATTLQDGFVVRRRVELQSPTIYRFSNPAGGFWISVRCIKQ